MAGLGPVVSLLVQQQAKLMARMDAEMLARGVKPLGYVEPVRFLVTQSVYGGPAIYDRETREVSAFVNDRWLVLALVSCSWGGRDKFVWRPAYAEEQR